MDENHGTGSVDKTDRESAQVQKPGTKRASAEYIVSRIHMLEYHQSLLLPHKTFCEIKLDNGFCVTGESAPADPENFNPEFGRKLAYDNAFRHLWPLFGFLICEDRHQNRDTPGL
jgi:hypothetical protein